MTLFFVGYDFPAQLPVGEPGSAERMASDFNFMVSLMRDQIGQYREKFQKQDLEIARLKLQQQQQQQQQQLLQEGKLGKFNKAVRYSFLTFLNIIGFSPNASVTAGSITIKRLISQ